MIRRLQPYSANIKKRLVKRPKLYWRDSGLLHSVLQLDNYDNLLRQPSVGSSWEGYVIEQILNRLNISDKPYQAWYLRTSD